MNNNNLISLHEDPIDLFAKWYQEAKKAELNDPNAMNLATISNDNKPSSRIVLLKSFSIKGFIFYTNTLSKKGKSLEINKYVALNFHWKALQKQIRIEGEAKKVSEKEADQYFDSRHFKSKISAWASSQSDYLSKRSELIKKFEIFKNKFNNNFISRPHHWTGYLIIPNLIEFWQDKPYRLHDRVEYKKTKDVWEARNLYP